jgi:hypothetical protein
VVKIRRYPAPENAIYLGSYPDLSAAPFNFGMAPTSTSVSYGILLIIFSGSGHRFFRFGQLASVASLFFLPTQHYGPNQWKFLRV